MKARCGNPNNISWPDYGGRGVKVCIRWQGPSGFPNFLADMGEKPEGTSLDRINVNGNYEPSNCRWATRHEQAHNKWYHARIRELEAQVLALGGSL